MHFLTEIQISPEEMKLCGTVRSHGNAGILRIHLALLAGYLRQVAGLGEVEGSGEGAKGQSNATADERGCTQIKATAGEGGGQVTVEGKQTTTIEL